LYYLCGTICLILVKIKKYELEEHSHRRHNILTGDWVQISPHPTKRPWQGQIENLKQESGVAYDEKCYLCLGNMRIGGDVNPEYGSTYVFVNDFAILQSDIPEGKVSNGLIQVNLQRDVTPKWAVNRLMLNKKLLSSE